MKRLLAATALLALVVPCLPVPASAGWGIVDFEIGAKGGAGGGLWNAPTRLPTYVSDSDQGFSKRRGGWAGGAGLYAQLRLLKCIGLEVDLLVDETRIREHPLDGYDWMIYAKSLNLHLPILVQGILPLPGIRIGLGVGPEFVWPLKTGTYQEDQGPAWANHPEFQGFRFSADSKMSTNLVFGLNFTPTVGHVSIPIDLRASYNLTQPKNYSGRVEWNDVADFAKGFKIHYQDTWAFRLLIGLGYAF